MGLMRIAALGAIGYAGYKYFAGSSHRAGAAFATGQGDAENFSQVRDAGPAAMADKPREWSKEDQMSDESFPASDPPATY